MAAASRCTDGFPHGLGIAAGSRLFIATFWIEIIWIISHYGFPEPGMKALWQFFSPSPCCSQFQCTNAHLQGQSSRRSAARAQLSQPGWRGKRLAQPGGSRSRGTGSPGMRHRSVQGGGTGGGTGAAPGAPCEAGAARSRGSCPVSTARPRRTRHGAPAAPAPRRGHRGAPESFPRRRERAELSSLVPSHST